jgi:hypothetical protein
MSVDRALATAEKSHSCEIAPTMPCVPTCTQILIQTASHRAGE